MDLLLGGDKASEVDEQKEKPCPRCPPALTSSRYRSRHREALSSGTLKGETWS